MNSRILLFGTIVRLGLGVPGGRAVEPTAAVELVGDRIVVRLDGVVATAAVDAIARATGAVVDGRPTRTELLSTAFEDTRWEQVLTRILGGQAFTATYTSAGQLKKIVLLAAAASPPTLAPRSTPVAVVPDAGDAETGLYALATNAWSASTTRARAAAVVDLARTIEARPLVAAIALPTLRAIGADRLATGLQVMLGRRARRTLRRIARETRVAAVEEAAADVLHALR